MIRRLLRSLPVRIMLLVAVVRMAQQWRRRATPVPPRRLVVSGGDPTPADLAEPADTTEMTPPKVDGQVYGG